MTGTNESLQQIQQQQQNPNSQQNQQPPANDGNGDDGASDPSMPGVSRKTLLVLGGVFAVAVVVWYLRRRTERSTAAGQDIPVYDESQHSGDQQPHRSQSYEIVHDPADPLGADEQALGVLREDGMMQGGGE